MSEIPPLTPRTSHSPARKHSKISQLAQLLCFHKYFVCETSRRHIPLKGLKPSRGLQRTENTLQLATLTKASIPKHSESQKNITLEGAGWPRTRVWGVRTWKFPLRHSVSRLLDVSIPGPREAVKIGETLKYLSTIISTFPLEHHYPPNCKGWERS